MRRFKNKFLLDQAVKFCGYGAICNGFAAIRLDVQKNQTEFASWYSCRETFGGYFDEHTKIIAFGLGHGNGASLEEEIHSLVSFFKRIETKLGRKDNIYFQRTSQTRTVLVHIPKWWRAEQIRRDILTILLRAGRLFKGNVEKALHAIDYYKVTKEAFSKFFKGYTKLKTDYSYHGWVDYFDFRFAHSSHRDQRLNNLLKPRAIKKK
jgi:hypothetical protein